MVLSIRGDLYNIPKRQGVFSGFFIAFYAEICYNIKDNIIIRKSMHFFDIIIKELIWFTIITEEMHRRSAVPITEISETDTGMTAANEAAHVRQEEAAVTAKDVPTMMSVSAISPSVMSALSVMMNVTTTAVLLSAGIPLSRL